jgi:hypothetical protein
VDALGTMPARFPDFQIRIGYVEAIRLARSRLLEIELVSDGKDER